MKTPLIIILFLLTLSVNLFSQYSLPLRLVNSDGSPNTGEASNIVFTRYPHSYGTDNVSGITVTEVGTAGNYICKGFTTYEYVKLWLSGVEQTWFDSVQVGNVKTYISTNYILKAGTVTGITGNKTISSGNWLWSGSNTTFYKPYLEGSSPWITDYSQMLSTSLVPVGYADSVYGIKPYYISGSNIILLSGNKIWGTSLSQPIQINTNHFTWSTSTGLNISLPYQYDSLYIKKDTIISENTYTKSWNLKRKYWSQMDSSNLYWYYKNSLANSKDSFAVINSTIQLSYDNTTRSVDSADITRLDTFYCPDYGTWDIKVTFEYEFEYVTPNNTGYDSLRVGVYIGDPTDEANVLDFTTIKASFNSGVPFGMRNRGQLSYTFKVTPAVGDYFYLTAITSGICHSSGGSQKVWIRKHKVEALRVR